MAGHSVIECVGFSLNGDEENLRNSHAAIDSCELFTAGGEPVLRGAYDLRLGSIDHAFLCTTCAHGKKLCPGHRGHLALRAGVAQAIAVPEIRRWLRVTCFRCGEIVVDREKYAHLPAERRLAEAAASATEQRRCPRPGCGALHPKITKDTDDHYTFWAGPAEGARGAAARGAPPPAPEGAVVPSGRAGAGAAPGARQGVMLYPDAIRAIFERVGDEACRALGRDPATAHPRKLILRVLNVPPSTIRPGVKSFGGAGNSHHDSTNLLQHLIKRNEALPRQLPDAMGPLGPEGPVDPELDRALTNLSQIHYDYVMGSPSTSVTQGNSGRRGLVVGTRPVHSVLRGLARKEGRIRSNMLGKRVFYISRSTICGNMRFRVDEVGVPLEFARVLQIEETVQEYNRDWLMPFFLNGRRTYPGSTRVVRRATGETHDVAGLRDARLEVGDVLFRDLIDGDLVFFNRQPSLERSSIGVHKAIVILDPGVSTFQMNVLACVFYNADGLPSTSATGSCLERCLSSLRGKQCKNGPSLRARM